MRKGVMHQDKSRTATTKPPPIQSVLLFMNKSLFYYVVAVLFININLSYDKNKTMQALVIW